MYEIFEDISNTLADLLDANSEQDENCKRSNL